jgi:hypothetical protein
VPVDDKFHAATVTDIKYVCDKIIGYFVTSVHFNVGEDIGEFQALRGDTFMIFFLS